MKGFRLPQATLRTRLIIGFAVVTAPLVILLLWNNLYSTTVVRSQVAQSNRSLLTMYMNDMDKVLEEIQNYLFKTAEQNRDLLSLSQNDRGGWDYYRAKTQMAADLGVNSNYYEAADVLFAYSSKYDDLFVSQQQSVSFQRKREIQRRLHEILKAGAGAATPFSGWTVTELNGSYALVRIVDTGYGSAAGAWVDLDRLMRPLHALGESGKGEALLLGGHSGSLPLTTLKAGLRDELQATGAAADTEAATGAYTIAKLPQPYLLVAQPSRMAGMRLVLLVPEKSLLEGLPYFRYLTYTVPVLAAILLALYLYYLQRAVVVPMHRLIKGMRKIRSGDLSARLPDSRLPEFVTINETFNGMASQIEHLKIDIYEEHIRTQKAELKHLQAQIQPHFFMNSLNIVYQLAQIRSFDIIQSIALHLVRYFRFTINTSAASVTILQELEHIRDYLTIQKHRFPETLEFDFNVEAGLDNYLLPPLSIQPIVENAMVHGFSTSGGGPFRISIAVSRDGTAGEGAAAGGIRIDVADNGKGFAPGMAERLAARVQEQEPGERHVGLWNVARRCRLYYGDSVTLKFENGAGRGALVTLGLPGEQAADNRQAG
ncbi:sensor histidine kinase [Paenibacillus sp. D51F]